MRLSALPLLACLATAGSLYAQQPAVALVTPSSQGCPVGLDARHAEQGALVATDRSHLEPDRHHAQPGYRLTFLSPDARAVVQAKIRLHGLAGPTVLPAGASGEGTATEELTLTPTRSAARHFLSVLYTEKLTGVQWIEVESLRYADGTTWTASSASLCRVAPNGFTLVAAGK